MRTRIEDDQRKNFVANNAFVWRRRMYLIYDFGNGFAAHNILRCASWSRCRDAITTPMACVTIIFGDVVIGDGGDGRGHRMQIVHHVIA